MKISQLIELPRDNNVVKGLSAALVLSYVIRATIAGQFIPQDLAEKLNYASLIVCAFYVFLQPNKRVNVLAASLLFFTCVSIAFSPYFDVALIRTIFWALIFVVAGPMFTSPKIDRFREYLWRYSSYAIFLISVSSLFWNILGFPVSGKGMAGVTSHAMLLGALAGIAVVLSFNNILALGSQSFLNAGIFAASCLSCLISGSRSAVMAAVLGIAVASLIRFRGAIRFASYSVVLSVAFLVWISFGADGESLFNDDYASNAYTSELANKGMKNSREELWANRIEEFNDNPISGVGIGVDTFKFLGGSSENNVIEPGSSYLAVLSMTGLLGAAGLFLMLFGLVRKAFKNGEKSDRNEFIKVISLGAFWAVHAVGEGWIFAGGSMLCLFFWIWVGRLATLNGGVLVNSKDVF